MAGMMRAECKACGWLFDVIALPAPIDVCAPPMQHCYCPLCGNLKGNLCGPERSLTADEANHLREREKAKIVAMARAQP